MWQDETVHGWTRRFAANLRLVRPYQSIEALMNHSQRFLLVTLLTSLSGSAFPQKPPSTPISTRSCSSPAMTARWLSPTPARSPCIPVLTSPSLAFAPSLATPLLVARGARLQREFSDISSRRIRRAPNNLSRGQFTNSFGVVRRDSRRRRPPTKSAPLLGRCAASPPLSIISLV